MTKKYKLLDHPWHLGHQWEMIKFPFAEWFWLNQFKRPYHDRIRGEFDVQYVNHYEKGKYDAVILHLDQQAIEEPIYEMGKASLYRELNELITDVPKIVMMHGTPYFPEKMETEQIIAILKGMVGDNPMLVNSHTAKKQWCGYWRKKGQWNRDGSWKENGEWEKKFDGFPEDQVQVIIHGMDPDEWMDLPKEPRVITMISPAGLDKYYDRVFLSYTFEALEERGITACHITVDWRADTFDDYREFLGRSLIYFNPTRESPMPRSRTEAMLSGCCIITTPHQDASDFIRQGENGFIIPRKPEAAADLCVQLIKNYKAAVQIGQNGKKTAIKLFGVERYQQDWYWYLQKVIGQYKKHG